VHPLTERACREAERIRAEREGRAVPGLADQVRAQGELIEALTASLAAAYRLAEAEAPPARPALRLIQGGG
jgi:hypothetical protein